MPPRSPKPSGIAKKTLRMPITTRAATRRAPVWNNSRRSGLRSATEAGEKQLGPHPEEAAPLGAGRLEGWQRVHTVHPSFETRASKSAVADFDTVRLPKSGRPDFGARSPA